MSCAIYIGSVGVVYWINYSIQGHYSIQSHLFNSNHFFNLKSFIQLSHYSIQGHLFNLKSFIQFKVIIRFKVIFSVQVIYSIQSHLFNWKVIIQFKVFLFHSKTFIVYYLFIEQLNLKKTLLDRMVHLLSCGCVLPIMTYIRSSWEKKDTDISLIRHFVTEVSPSPEKLLSLSLDMW